MLRKTTVHVSCSLIDGSLREIRDQGKILTLQSPTKVIYLSRSDDTCNLLLLLSIFLLLPWKLHQKMTILTTLKTLYLTQVLLSLALHPYCECHSPCHHQMSSSDEDPRLATLPKWSHATSYSSAETSLWQRSLRWTATIFEWTPSKWSSPSQNLK